MEASNSFLDWLTWICLRTECLSRTWQLKWQLTIQFEMYLWKMKCECLVYTCSVCENRLAGVLSGLCMQGRLFSIILSYRPVYIHTDAFKQIWISNVIILCILLREIWAFCGIFSPPSVEVLRHSLYFLTVQSEEEQNRPPPVIPGCTVVGAGRCNTLTHLGMPTHFT